MPKNKVETKMISKAVFKKVLEAKGSSIRKLGAVEQNLISPTEKTIRRQLNAGRMRPDYIDEIARYLDVDPRILTGEIIFLPGYKNIYPLEHLEEYPYFRQERDEYLREDSREILTRVLSIFNRSYSQFEKMTYDDKYLFQKELFEAMFKVVTKHFTVNAYGNKDNFDSELVLIALDCAKEDHDLETYADTTLRDRFSNSPPEGYTKEQINKMTPEELLDLDMSLQWSDEEIGEKEIKFNKKHNID